MSPIKAIFQMILAYWICSVGNATFIPSLQVHISDDYKRMLILSFAHRYEYVWAFTDFPKSNDVFGLDCSRFKNDYEILSQLPFPVLANPIEQLFNQSTVIMDDNDRSASSIYLYEENFIPQTVFCLSKLKTLYIQNTPFINGSIYKLATLFHSECVFRNYTGCFSKFETA